MTHSKLEEKQQGRLKKNATGSDGLLAQDATVVIADIVFYQPGVALQ